MLSIYSSSAPRSHKTVIAGRESYPKVPNIGPWAKRSTVGTAQPQQNGQSLNAK